ncbi:hypothetical protein V5740_01565 [Croceibacterium sp. TMG7-5b_MA50]|uniref:hypothetical protein n=1 Tax=Croceibacterium sp. TMG7-5b_MA50 TaxID=3121290 RepID=UPI003221D983
MPRLLPLCTLTLFGLAACRQEPSFDERYDAAQKQVGTTAARLDKEMVAADRQAEADRRAVEAARATGQRPPPAS